ncbi:hypothetical protein SVAN01_02928 [Stagonosporopsis vannaccii]|nr:hypothetical protein SVAN01_02928 [Stagonosporopsis vannaccii]
MGKRRRPTEPEEAVEINTVSDGRMRKEMRTQRRRRRAIGRSCGEGGLRAGVGDEVLALLGTRPWFTLWKPRVFRLAPLRPGTALCTRMKDADGDTRTMSKTLCCPLGDGVVAGEQCQTNAMSSADCSPPSRIVAQNLIYLLHASIAVPGKLLQRTKGPSALHDLKYRHAAAALSCAAANMSYAPILLPPVLSIEAALRRKARQRGEKPPYSTRLHTTTASCSLANISNPGTLFGAHHVQSSAASCTEPSSSHDSQGSSTTHPGLEEIMRLPDHYSRDWQSACRTAAAFICGASARFSTLTDCTSETANLAALRQRAVGDRRSLTCGRSEMSTKPEAQEDDEYRALDEHWERIDEMTASNRPQVREQNMRDEDIPEYLRDYGRGYSPSYGYRLAAT